MSSSWSQRKTRLKVLLGPREDEAQEALALDSLLHGQTVIGKTPKTSEIEKVRFSEKDLDVVGALAHGQFGTVELVNCRLDGRVYVRKKVEKKIALKAREQCFPQTERHILLLALKESSVWVPQMLCAFQDTTHLSIVMQYAEAGSLWDVIESSSDDSRISEGDLRWWVPQCVSAIHWCHGQGFVHRDIKPHNFVLKPSGHILLIDFASAAPLLPMLDDGVQLLPKRYCVVPCGTCDYISPEILKAHEEALVALEMSDATIQSIHQETRLHSSEEESGYGREADWWSLGAMIYEMAYGVAPFFANDIRRTYARIMDHQKNLKFHAHVSVSEDLISLIQRFLSQAEIRLGRHSIQEIIMHCFFRNIDWNSLHSQPSPTNLLIPQFTYTVPLPGDHTSEQDSSLDESSSSRAFAFSALFQSSSPAAAATPKAEYAPGSSPAVRASAADAFIGFSWGPTLDAFDSSVDSGAKVTAVNNSPLDGARLASINKVPQTSTYGHLGVPTPVRNFTTPVRPSALYIQHTLPRSSTVGRNASRRPFSDREAMKQLVQCVGMSARKRILESGRKPRVLPDAFMGGRRSSIINSNSNSNSNLSSFRMKKELRFDPVTTLPQLKIDTASTTMGSEDTESLMSPSPSPRPMSAMSRRSATPTMTISGAFAGLQSLKSQSVETFASYGASSPLLAPPENMNATTADLSASTSKPDEVFHSMRRRYNSLMRDMDDVEKQLYDLRGSCLNN